MTENERKLIDCALLWQRVRAASKVGTIDSDPRKVDVSVPTRTQVLQADRVLEHAALRVANEREQASNKR